MGEEENGWPSWYGLVPDVPIIQIDSSEIGVAAYTIGNRFVTENPKHDASERPRQMKMLFSHSKPNRFKPTSKTRANKRGRSSFFLCIGSAYS